MCLFVDDTVKLPETLTDEGGEYFIGYKLLSVISYTKKLISIWSYYLYKVGWNIANGRKEVFTDYNEQTEISSGYIHLYLKHDEALNDKTKYELGDRIVVPVKCYVKDVAFIGKNHIYSTGTSDGACVKQVFLEESDYNNAIGAE